jgi:hypothetical protein
MIIQENRFGIQINKSVKTNNKKRTLIYCSAVFVLFILNTGADLYEQHEVTISNYSCVGISTGYPDSDGNELTDGIVPEVVWPSGSGNSPLINLNDIFDTITFTNDPLSLLGMGVNCGTISISLATEKIVFGDASTIMGGLNTNGTYLALAPDNYYFYQNL